ncbi:MAG TPA: ABC transporter substrate-binding protein [Steroidobacteraceae bacterium]|jgi:NitT/TauT family transport system substrate-binding protein|nr:ABC transporter substrate-binding protein [Steroidobacteraceae bacterium]
MPESSFDKALASIGSFRVASILIALTGLLGLSSCGSAPKAGAEPLRIATYHWPGSYWIDVADRKGWFRDAGLDVQRIDVDGAYFHALDEVVNGKIDAMGFPEYDLVKRVADGHDLVGVAVIDYSSGAEGLVAKPGIHSLRDLKGKRLALYRGSYLEYLLSILAEREGVDIGDIVLVDRSGDASVDDFKAGRVDAIFLWEPYVSYAVAAGGVTLFSTADTPGLSYSVFALRGEYIRQHREQVAALMRVWDRTERWVREHPQEACGMVAASLKQPPDSTCGLMRTVRILDLADNERAFSYAAGFESLHGSWRRMNDFMLETGEVARRVDSPPHLDSEFIRMLE